MPRDTIAPFNPHDFLATDEEEIPREKVERLSHDELVALVLALFSERTAWTEKAMTDPLTGLLNRRGLASEAEKIIKRATGRKPQQPLALLLVDIDHFKTVNDTYGHDAGDQVLEAVAQSLRHAIRPNDRVARHGGEEFLVLLSGVGQKKALKIAERVRSTVAEIALPGLPFVTVSVGVAVSLVSGHTLETLTASADKALYVAKETGRDRVVLASTKLLSRERRSESRRKERERSV